MDDKRQPNLYEAFMRWLNFSPIEVLWALGILALLATGLFMGWDMGR